MRDGHQHKLIDIMQTREQFYQFLGYHDYERKLDELFAQDEEKISTHEREQTPAPACAARPPAKPASAR